MTAKCQCCGVEFETRAFNAIYCAGCRRITRGKNFVERARARQRMMARGRKERLADLDRRYAAACSVAVAVTVRNGVRIETRGRSPIATWGRNGAFTISNRRVARSFAGAITLPPASAGK